MVSVIVSLSVYSAAAADKKVDTKVRSHRRFDANANTLCERAIKLIPERPTPFSTK